MKCPFKQQKPTLEVPPANEDNSFNGILAHAMKKQEYNEYLSNLNDCDEWECAWWVNDEQKCAVVVIAEKYGFEKMKSLRELLEEGR